jgi:Flp pilus assembly protein TadD
LVAVTTLAAFAPVSRHEFLPYDDHVYVTANSHVLDGLTADGLRWSLTATDGGSWHPLTWWSHMLDVQLFGTWAGGHHLTSVAIHAGAAALLFLALSGMTGAVWASLAAALLFALHPLHVESVAWVSERKDVLAGLFWMAAMTAYLAYVRRPGRGRLLAVVGLFALGLLSKPIVVTLPVVLLVLDWWPLGRLRDARPAGVARLVGEKAPLFALAAAAGVLAMKTQVGAYAFEDIGSVPGPFRTAMLSASVVNACVSYVVYLGKTVWPSGLAVFYPYPAHALGPWKAAAALALLVAATAAAVRLRRRAPYLAAGWLWYLVTLLPVIGLLQVGAQARADRYTYLPLVGLFLAAAWAVAGVVRARPGVRPVVAAASAAVIAASAVATAGQLAHWRSGTTLFEHALAVTADNYLAHQILGGISLRRGDFVAAEAHYRRVLALRPRYPGAHISLGLALSGQGKLVEALPQYRAEMRLAPSDPEPHNNLGVDLTALGRLEDAERELRLAVALAPRTAEIHSNLGDALALQGKIPEAAEAYRRALALKPGLAQARDRLGRLPGGADPR